MSYSFHNKVAIVTGGARGIGEATVRLLVERGAQVLIGDVLEDEGRLLAAELGERVVFQKMDVGERDDWEKAVSGALELGALTVLVARIGQFQAVSHPVTHTKRPVLAHGVNVICRFPIFRFHLDQQIFDFFVRLHDSASIMFIVRLFPGLEMYKIKKRLLPVAVIAATLTVVMANSYSVCASPGLA